MVSESLHAIAEIPEAICTSLLTSKMFNSGLLDQFVKVARPSIFVGAPSIFESLILKQIDLYCKNIRTHVLPID